MRDLLAVPDLAQGETTDQLISAVNKILDAGTTTVSYEIEHLYDTGGLSYAEHLTSILLA
jgi:hypothetical protein